MLLSMSLLTGAGSAASKRLQPRSSSSRFGPMPLQLPRRSGTIDLRILGRWFWDRPHVRRPVGSVVGQIGVLPALVSDAPAASVAIADAAGEKQNHEHDQQDGEHGRTIPWSCSDQPAQSIRPLCRVGMESRCPTFWTDDLPVRAIAGGACSYSVSITCDEWGADFKQDRCWPSSLDGQEHDEGLAGSRISPAAARRQPHMWLGTERRPPSCMPLICSLGTHG